MGSHDFYYSYTPMDVIVNTSASNSNEIEFHLLYRYASSDYYYYSTHYIKQKLFKFYISNKSLAYYDTYVLSVYYSTPSCFSYEHGAQGNFLLCYKNFSTSIQCYMYSSYSYIYSSPSYSAVYKFARQVQIVHLFPL